MAIIVPLFVTVATVYSLKKGYRCQNIYKNAKSTVGADLIQEHTNRYVSDVSASNGHRVQELENNSEYEQGPDSRQAPPPPPPRTLVAKDNYDHLWGNYDRVPMTQRAPLPAPPQTIMPYSTYSMDSDHLYEGQYQEVEANLGTKRAKDELRNVPAAPTAYLPHELVLRKEN